MNRIAFADKTGIFAWSDVQNCRDILPQRDIIVNEIDERN